MYEYQFHDHNLWEKQTSASEINSESSNGFGTNLHNNYGDVYNMNVV